LFRREVSWLLLDEPDAYLDIRRRRLLVALLGLAVTTGKGVLVVSHNPNLYPNHSEVKLLP